MKKIIQRLTSRFGYQICKIARPDERADPFIAMKKLLQGTYEPIVFDVGAHHGLIAKTFRELFPNSTVYAFEPFKESYEQLRVNTLSDSRIHVYNYGLSDQVGTKSFHSNSSSATNSIFSTHASGSETWAPGLLETEKIVQAEFRTLDSVVDELQIPVIDILKLDVQGAEPLILSGSTETCNRGAIKFVYSEIITQPTYIGQKRFDAALSSFYDRGFDLYNMYNMSFTDEGRLRQIDAIFTRTLR